MKKDRFLIGILVIIAVLVIVSIALFLARQNSQAYGPEDTPEGVVRNYLIALSFKDYSKAYTYLKEATYKPPFELFRQAFISRQVDPSGVAVQLGQVQTSAGKAWVDLYLLREGNGLFSDSFQETAQATLEQDASGAWKIANMPYPHWGWDWYTPTPVPVKGP
jgi:hypothetical protein